MSELIPVLDEKKTKKNIKTKLKTFSRHIRYTSWFKLDLESNYYSLYDSLITASAKEINKDIYDDIYELDFESLIIPLDNCPPLVWINVKTTLIALNKLNKKYKGFAYFHLIRGLSLADLKAGTCGNEETIITGAYLLFNELVDKLVFVWDECLEFKELDIN